jgi:hypothetical protein
MAKSKDKQPAKPESRTKGDKTFTKVDKKAFDPALASLFASSVSDIGELHCASMLTEFTGRSRAASTQDTLPGPRAGGE